MKRILVYLKDLQWAIMTGLLVKVFATLMDLALPWLLSIMIDTVAPTRNMKFILLGGLVMLVCSALSVITNIVANRMASRVSCNAIVELRNDVFSKVYSLSIKQLEDITISSTVSRLTNDTQNILNMIMSTLRIGIRAPIMLIGGIFFTMTMDMKLSLLLVVLMPLVFAATYWVTRKGASMHRKIQQSGDRLISVVRDAVSGIAVIKAFGAESREKERFAKASGEVMQNELATASMMSMLNPSINFLLNIGLVLVVLVGAVLVTNGHSSVGNIIAFLSYFTMISTALLAVNRLFTVVARAFASAGRITELLDMESEQPYQKQDQATFDEHIVFQNVSFSYNGEKTVLRNISFCLAHGQTLGIVGATGAGKSTLVQLLQGFYKPYTGAIYINGDNIAEKDEEEIHKQFGVVLQNDSIFADSIANNIRLGRNIAEEDIWKSLRYAQLEEFVRSQPLGLEYPLTTGGGNLSGGQKQRLLIARALAGNPQILVLDDTGSALDYRTDAIVRRAIRENLKCTTVIIAQRVTSVMSADIIIYLSENGEILAMGTHKQMLKACPSYREMWTVQTGGDIDEE